MTRFTETVSIDNKLFKPLTEAALNEKLQALSADSRKLIESTHPSGITAWEVPISKYDEVNANGRLYSKALWERVINEQRNIWQGGPMLADHPSGENDGSPDKICGVWLESRIANDGYVYGTFVPSGRLGEDLQKHLKNGLRAGTSSSGFGDLMHDNKTVDPSTYMIERLSDWVLTPSQGTYFTYEDSTQETKNASDSRLGESANKPVNVVRENVMKLTKLEEKKFRKDMLAFLEDAESLSSPTDRLQEFEEILSYFDEGASPDLRETVVAKIAEQRKEIETKLTEAAKFAEELGVTGTQDLKEKLTVIAEDTEILKAEATDWKQIATALQEKLDKTRADLQARPTNAYVSHLRSKMKKAYTEKRDQEKLIAEAKAATAAAVSKKTSLLEAIDAEIGEAKKVVADREATIESLRKQVERMQIRFSKSEQSLKEARDEFALYKANAEAKPKMMESPADGISKYVNFREGTAIDAYWSDLVLRHGAEIKVYESKIRSAKSYREAQQAYMRILPLLNESVDYTAALLPESVAISIGCNLSQRAWRNAGENGC